MSTISRWYDKLKEGAAIGNINLQLSPSDLEKEFVEAGYVNVKVVLYPLPMGPLPKVRILKLLNTQDTGLWQQVIVNDGLAAYSLAILTRYLKWSVEQVNKLLDEVRIEIRSKYHWHWKL